MNLTHRRKGALKRLNANLESGEKTGKKSFKKVALTTKDKERIKGEIKTLKSLII